MVRYPHANPSLATRAILVPKGLEQLAQRQALLAKQERGAYPPNCKQLLTGEHKPWLASIRRKPQKNTPNRRYIVKIA